MKMKPLALGGNLVIKVECGEIKVGSIVVAAEGTRESQAREVGTILHLGEDAFNDLHQDNRPKLGDRVVIARYDGKIISENKDKGYDLRVIADTRCLALLTPEGIDEKSELQLEVL